MAHRPNPVLQIFPPPGLFSGPAWSGVKVGLLGGSFNPAHKGHYHISKLALQYLGLDCVWWMVSPQNPLKPTAGMADMQKRIDHAKHIATHPRIVVTNIEKKLQTRYTADTLDSLHKRYPETSFVWLMGADNLHQIHKWQRWRDIFLHTPIAVFNRPPMIQAITNAPAANYYRNAFIPPDKAFRLVKSPPPSWTLFHTPLNQISATSLRQKGFGLE